VQPERQRAAVVFARRVVPFRKRNRLGDGANPAVECVEPPVLFLLKREWRSGARRADRLPSEAGGNHERRHRDQPVFKSHGRLPSASAEPRSQTAQAAAKRE
jgi:hypothetical protein